MKEIESKARRAIERYDMIRDGDRVAAAVSGGKDSLMLLDTLAGLRRYLPEKFELCAITLDGRFAGHDTDYSKIEEYCRELDIPYYIKRSDLREVVFDIRQEKNPCALCARMRRGALHDMCVEHGCNRIALGHHMDDAVETFFLNLFHGGRIASFAPSLFLSRKQLWQIRPLVFCTEAEIASAALHEGLPVVKSDCPQTGNGERAAVKRFIAEQTKLYPNFLTTTFGALQRDHVSGF